MEGRRLHTLGSGKGQVEGCCEHGNEHSDSIKRGEFDHLRDHQLFTDSAPWSYPFCHLVLRSVQWWNGGHHTAQN